MSHTDNTNNMHTDHTNTPSQQAANGEQTAGLDVVAQQNNPAQDLYPREDNCSQHVLAALAPYSGPDGPLTVERVAFQEGRGNVIITYAGTGEGSVGRGVGAAGGAGRCGLVSSSCFPRMRITRSRVGLLPSAASASKACAARTR